MAHLFANDRDGDPANFEKYPDRYVRVKCAQCKECVLDRQAGRCFSGGPYTENLEFGFNKCQVL